MGLSATQIRSLPGQMVEYPNQQQPRGSGARASLPRPGVPRQARELAGPDCPTQPLLPLQGQAGGPGVSPLKAWLPSLYSRGHAANLTLQGSPAGWPAWKSVTSPPCTTGFQIRLVSSPILWDGVGVLCLLASSCPSLGFHFPVCKMRTIATESSKPTSNNTTLLLFFWLCLCSAFPPQNPVSCLPGACQPS